MKQIKFIVIVLIIIVAQNAFTQNLLNEPESVTWDHINQRWLVSNYASGEIVAIDTTGEQTLFTGLLSSTVGLKVHEDRLYAASSDGIVIFELDTGFVVGLIYIPEASLLNDIDFDAQGNLFVTDYWDNNIFKVNVETLTYELFIDYGIIAPNGIIFDAEFNRMIVCGHNGTTSIMHSFDVETAESELLLYPNIYSLDGLARDSQGNIYVSSWHTDAVYRFDGNNINNNITLAADGFIDPADIYINPSNNILAVPNFYADSVSFVQLDPPVSANDEPIPVVNANLSNYPNPFNPSTTISFQLNTESIEHTEIVIYNLRGQRIRQFSIFKNQSSIVWDGKNQADKPVSSGIYYAVLTQDGKIIASNKMLLMK